MSDELLIILIGIAIALGVLIVVGLGAFFVWRNRHSKQLQEKFGPEYEYALDQTGDRRIAEAELEEREKRVRDLTFRDLEPDERVYFSEAWENTQSQFVDKPTVAVEKANQLVKEVMNARGFPSADFERRAADISVVFPDVVPNYRHAHEIAIKNQRNEATTEELRQAMIYYRSLFAELLEIEKSKI